jgi:hypothetical protein
MNHIQEPVAVTLEAMMKKLHLPFSEYKAKHLAEDHNVTEVCSALLGIIYATKVTNSSEVMHFLFAKIMRRFSLLMNISSLQ